MPTRTPRQRSTALVTKHCPLLGHRTEAYCRGGERQCGGCDNVWSRGPSIDPLSAPNGRRSPWRPPGMKRRWPIPGDTCNDPAAQHPRALAQRDCHIHSTSPYRTNRTSPDDTSCCSSSGRTTLCVRPVDPSSRLAHATIARLSRHPCRPSPHEWGGDLRSPVYTPWGIYATLSSKPPLPGS